MIAKSPDMTEAEMVAEYARSRKSLETTFFGEGKYAAYILGDVDASAFQPNELKALTQRVEDGAGLVVLAGERSLSLGGYAETPLAKAFPVQTSAADRLTLDSDLATMDATADNAQRIRIKGRFAPCRADGRTRQFHRAAKPRREKNKELWLGMPDLDTSTVSAG